MMPMVPIQWVAAMRKLNPRKPNKRSSESGENQRESARVIPDARNGNLRRSRTKACFCTSSSPGNIRAPGSTISKTSSEAQSFPSSTRISGPSSTRPRSDIGETDHPPGSGSPPSSGKWKTSDKENLTYFRIWKSLTYSNRLRPALGRLYKGNLNPKARDRHFET
ncbi:hypothetical protein F2Q70_00002855 [Brassica cretica]|uniref:Uncharacterized protein n=1 Tax=Brassica cretica TaxID=69181 RepID=A0A8S9IPG0_BRACR|nr:hypothetical protein F2Q70_00002855 [Brassica cretica]